MALNSITLILGKMATMALGFVVWLVAAKLFAPAEVGLASGTVSAMMLCVQLALFGAGAAVISLYPQHLQDPGELLDTAIGVVATTSLIAGGGFLLMAAGILQEFRVVVERPAYAIAFLAMCAFGTLGVLFDQIGTVLRRGDQVLVRNVVFSVVALGTLVALPVLARAESALAILLAWVAGGLVGLVLGYIQLRRAQPGYRFVLRMRRGLARQLVGVGLPNWALTLTERAPGTILPIVVIELLSPAANATWYAVWMMAWVVYVIPIQIGLSLFAEASHRPQKLGSAVRQGLRLSAAIGAIGAAGAAIFGPLMLSFLGESYASAGTAPLRILLLAVFPFALIQAYFSVCRARRQLAEAILTGVLAGGVGVVAAALAAQSSGLNGMAVAWVVTQVVAGVWAAARLRVLLSAAQSNEVQPSASSVV